MAEVAGAPAHMWFVRTGGEVWGPYPAARIAAFVREGRVGAGTLLSPFAAGPWSAAADTTEFAAGLTAAKPIPSPQPIETKAPPRQAFAASDAPVALVARNAPAAPSAQAPMLGPERAMLVFAELSSVAPAAFQTALGRLGRCVSVRPGLWLLRAPTTASALRNLLSSRLGAGDALLVVEAPLDQAAWFNLAPDHDRALRQLWSGGR